MSIVRIQANNYHYIIKYIDNIVVIC